LRGDESWHASLQTKRVYTISLSDDVASAVADFTPDTLRYWNVFLDKVAVDPFPRFAGYVEQPIPIRGFPMRTWNYYIEERTSISGERIFLFVAEFLTECTPVYSVDEDAQIVDVFSLREGWI